MKSRSILILGSGQLCRNPRVLKEAITLSDAGYTVTVMNVANSERFEAHDRDIMRGCRFRKISLDQLSSTWSGRLAKNSARLRSYLARRIGLRLGFESPNALGPVSALAQLALRYPADLTIVHTEMAFCIGAELIARGRNVAADFEDWHSQDLLPEARSERPLKLLARVEQQLLQHAIYSTTTSKALAQALQVTYGGHRPTVLTNSFPLQTAPAFTANTPPVFIWFSQTIGPGRGLEAFIDAWSLMDSPSCLRLLGDSCETYRTALQARVPAGRRQQLEFRTLVTPAELPGILAHQDIGLALEPDSPVSRSLTITNKILQYLNAGLAVLATATAGQREVLEQAPGAGELINLTDAPTLARHLDELLRSPGRLMTMRRAARRAAETTFCWEQEAPRLLSLVESALALPAQSAVPRGSTETQKRQA
ncbi:MAG: glycosyltransferase [Opitutus sp.]|nr:glycosyltransferase [Opitutus sp.]MCS6246103.1 glycosyltransferase [Opitutus sp.]MCS6273645.1 glycosyltransferase [Opitutus sp.]MCS6277812.1 glycosyltransferase [Opitutus sp.]MCS6299082.1 glycosyltransferase [Opitutus sp.]